MAGTLAMGLGGLTVLALLQRAAQMNGMEAPGLPNLVLIAAVATALEQLSVLGIDNLSVPLSTGLLWELWAR
jgi:phytol kinase